MRKSFWVPITLALAAYLVLPLPGATAPLSKRIDEKRAQLDQTKQKEGVLTTTIQSYSNRIEGLKGEISATQNRLGRVQQSLDHQKNELLEVRDRLEAARDRLERLRSELVTARRVLAARLVEIYKADAPDALTVILEADGFGDLLERAEFLDRISDQDREITDEVRALRDRAEGQAEQLADLEHREQLAAERILRERDQIASVAGAAGVVAQPACRGAERQARRPGPGAGQQARARGRPRGARGRAGAGGLGTPGRRRRRHVRGPHQAGQRPADLARQRPRGVAVRDALGTAPRGPRHRGARRHARSARPTRAAWC